MSSVREELHRRRRAQQRMDAHAAILQWRRCTRWRRRGAVSPRRARDHGRVGRISQEEEGRKAHIPGIEALRWKALQYCWPLLRRSPTSIALKPARPALSAAKIARLALRDRLAEDIKMLRMRAQQRARAHHASRWVRAGTCRRQHSMWMTTRAIAEYIAA